MEILLFLAVIGLSIGVILVVVLLVLITGFLYLRWVHYKTGQDNINSCMRKYMAVCSFTPVWGNTWLYAHLPSASTWVHPRVAHIFSFPWVHYKTGQDNINSETIVNKQKNVRQSEYMTILYRLTIQYNTIQYNTIFLFQLGSLKGQ
jgi:hypothetical protein